MNEDLNPELAANLDPDREEDEEREMVAEHMTATLQMMNLLVAQCDEEQAHEIYDRVAEVLDRKPVQPGTAVFIMAMMTRTLVTEITGALEQEMEKDEVDVDVQDMMIKGMASATAMIISFFAQGDKQKNLIDVYEMVCDGMDLGEDAQPLE
jgi:uncharacterized Zn finger protein